MDREKEKEYIIKETSDARYAAKKAAKAAAEKREIARQKMRDRVLATRSGNLEAEEIAIAIANAASKEAIEAAEEAIRAAIAAEAAEEAAEAIRAEAAEEAIRAPPRVAKRKLGDSENIGPHSTLSSDGKTAVLAAFSTHRGKIPEGAYKTDKTGPAATLVPTSEKYTPSTDNPWYGFFKKSKKGDSTRRGGRSKSRRSKSKRSKRSKKSKRNMGKTRRGKTRRRNTSRRATI